jgi:NitT/TauT family transport system ATP-binding protein
MTRADAGPSRRAVRSMSLLELKDGSRREGLWRGKRYSQLWPNAGSQFAGNREDEGKATERGDIFRAENLHITYENARSGELTRAVGGIDLKIGAGEFVTIAGLSGCGKSTFLAAVAGLTKATEGSISVAGRAVKGPGPDRAMVFQKPSLLPWRTVIDNVTYGLELRGVRRNDARARARRYLELVQIEEVEHLHPAALSGGMQQRVNLARALACDPVLLLLDEPFGALDAITRQTMQDELLNIWEATRKTVLMVSHQIDEAVLLSDRVIVFSDRPAKVIADIKIDLGRPRGPDVRESRRFTELVATIWKLIHQTAEARKAIA